MGFIADTHVHIYPQYDCVRALTGASVRLAAISREVRLPERPLAKILCLTERSSESFFSRLQAGRESGLKVTATEEEVSLRVEAAPDQSLLVIAGRQIVTRERLEVTVLGCLEPPPVGLSLDEVISWGASGGGIPVLNWSLGKWLGHRGERVERFVETERKQKFLLGDLAMRPGWLPRPKPMRLGAKRGVRIIAGSDPLPMAGEEDLIGSYVTWGTASLSEATPWRDFSELLLDPAAEVFTAGERGGIRALVSRSLRYRLSA